MSASRKDLGSNLEEVDAYENGPADYAEIPELTDPDFARGVIEVAGVPAKRGRPAPNGAKRQVTMRLDPDLISVLRNSGPGWQVRANAALRQAFLPDGKR